MTPQNEQLLLQLAASMVTALDRLAIAVDGLATAMDRLARAAQQEADR